VIRRNDHLIRQCLAGSGRRPPHQELAARGADRLSATMKRETGLSQGREALARAAVERREVSVLPKRSTRREETQEQARMPVGGPAVSTPCAFRRSASPLFGGQAFVPFVNSLDQNSGRQQKGAARERECFALHARKRGRGD